MTVKIFSAILKGCRAIPVTITVTSQEGYGISISGLITETIHRDLSRVQLALLNCGYGFKRKKLHIDIEPAIFEGGETLMLAIATGILIATGKVISWVSIRNYLIIGGLGITGKIHEIDGVASMAKMAKDKGFKGVILPASNIKIENLDYRNALCPVRNLNFMIFCLQNGLQKKMEVPATLLAQLNFN